MGQKKGKPSKGNGEGNIRLKSDGRWEARITIGYNDEGKQKVKYLYSKTRKECANKLNTFVSQNNNGTYIEPTKYSVSEWLDEWYKSHVINSVKLSTRVSYEMIIRRHLKPHFGHYKLKELKGSTVQGVYNGMLKNGRTDGKGGLSEKTIRNIHIVFREALQLAYNNDMIAKNPIGDGRITLPESPKHNEMLVFTFDEQKLLLRECKNNHLGMAILLDLNSGLRQGELLALTWDDIDFENRTLTINKQLSRLKNFDESIKSKTVLFVQQFTKNSNDRVISIATPILKKLENHRIKQEEFKKMWGKAYQNKNLVFCREDGFYVEPKTFQDFFKRTLKVAGIADANVHAMRHSFATRALEEGIQIKVVSEILGHSKVQITMDTYSHVLPQLQEEAIQKISDLFLDIDED